MTNKKDETTALIRRTLDADDLEEEAIHTEEDFLSYFRKLDIFDRERVFQRLCLYMRMRG